MPPKGEEKMIANDAMEIARAAGSEIRVRKCRKFFSDS